MCVCVWGGGDCHTLKKEHMPWALENRVLRKREEVKEAEKNCEMRSSTNCTGH